MSLKKSFCDARRQTKVCRTSGLISGAPGETRTHIPLLKRQVPLSHLATGANHFRLPNADFQLFRVLAGLTRLELAISASTVQRFDPTKLQPPFEFPISNCQLPILWLRSMAKQVT